MRAHVSCGSKVVLLVGLIFVLSCIALALATSSLQLTQSVVLEGASKDAQCPSFTLLLLFLLSGASSLAKHGGAYFSAVFVFMKDPIAAPGPFEIQEC